MNDTKPGVMEPVYTLGSEAGPKAQHLHFIDQLTEALWSHLDQTFVDRTQPLAPGD